MLQRAPENVPVRVDDGFSPGERKAIERQTVQIGRELLSALAQRRPNLFQRQWWDDRLMDWAMRDESVKVQMFRFVDVLPMLDSAPAVMRHLQEYFDEVSSKLPAAARLGLSVASPHSVTGRAVALTARRQALGQARRFIAGTNTEEALAAVHRQRKHRRAFTLDILGEAVTSEAEADRYLQAYIDLIRGIAPQVNSWPEIPQVDRDRFSELPRVNVSVKLSALDSQFDAIDPQGTSRRVLERLRKLLRVAREHAAYVHVDMESYATKDLTLEIFKQVFMEDEFRDVTATGIVIQCYLRDAERDLIALRDWAQARGTPVWVRLVKGAYWDYETVHAEAAGWPVPVYQQKWESDACFERCTRFLMRHSEYLRPALGSHNLRSLAHGIATARQLGLPTSAYEIQMLYGMADAEKELFTQRGHRVRVYMPYGELIPGMAYLVRRLLENTSNDSFLRAGFAEDRSVEELLMNPEEAAARAAQPLTSEPESPSMHIFGSSQPVEFVNEPSLDYALPKNQQRMQAALKQVRAELGREYPLFINGHRVPGSGRLTSVNPANFTEEIGHTPEATAADVDRAAQAAAAALPAWHALGAQRRAQFLRAAAEQMRQRKQELAAWMTLECGKGWREADGDVSEAIDFLEFYAAGAVALERPQGVDVPGEENRFDYLPRGVTAVIAPWNFPLAILVGMSSAALATGNTVLMKPAEQSPVIAAKYMEIMQQVGLPAGVLNLLPGTGEVAGRALVEHPLTNLIVFTGSRGVGLEINRRAAELSLQGTRWVKRVLAEMGGKNAIIVDDDADIDEAVQAVVASAFGYQGQKCSACSRVIVLRAVYETFLERLVEAARSLQIGPTEMPGNRLGPVIDAEAYQRVRDYIEIGREEAREVLAVDTSELAERGYFVGPHVFADVSPRARIAQEEIFGPVLAVIPVADMDEALRVVNDTDYALTAGIFSRSPANLERARREILVGNLYLNRGCTGSLVCRQPFGGFKLSGIGSKAGGTDYLLQFVVPRTVTENTLRRGFAPESTHDGE